MHVPLVRLPFVVIALLVACALPAYGQWVKVNPLTSTSAEIFDIAYGQNQWVAVGDRGLIALRQGDNWNELPLVSTNPLRSIRYTGTHFVAVGEGGIILAAAKDSPNQWAVLASHTTGKLINIQQLGSNWYILGESGLILISPDGLTWTVLRAADANGPNFTCMTLFGGQYIALVGIGGNAWRSADGVTWVQDSISTQVSYPLGIRVLNGTLVVWGSSGGLARSTDGLVWTKITSPLPNTSDPITGVVYINGRYFMTGSDNFSTANRTIYSSVDLVTWSATDGTARRSIVSDGSMFMAAAGSVVTTSPDGINWKNTKGYLTYPIAFVQGQFRAADRNFLYSSTDGLGWTESRLPTGVSGLGVYEANGKYLVYGGGKVSVSTDFQNWQSAAFAPGALGSDFLYAFGKYYAVMKGSPSASIYTSSNGLSWSSFTSGAAIAFGNGRLVAVNNASNVFQIQISTNGTSTTAYSISGQPGANAVAFGNGLFVAVYGSSVYKVRTSTDGITWTTQTTPTISGDLSEISFQNGRFVARGKGEILTSTDGITWTDVSYDAWEDENAPPYSIAYGNSVWLLAGGFPLRSADFPNWQLLTDVFDHNFIQVHYMQGAFWAVSQTKDNITTGSLWRSTDGLDWKIVERFPFSPVDVAISSTGHVVVASDFSKIAISNDLASWQLVDPGLGRIRMIVQYADSYYAATQAGVKQSADGITWSTANGVPSFDCVAITSSALGVTAVGSTGYNNKIYHSSDGISWADVHTANTPQYLNTICYSAPYLVASGGAGYFLKSSDGINWMAVASEFLGTLSQCITTNNGLLALSGGFINRSSFAEPIGFYPESLAAYIKSIAYGNGVSVALGNDSGIYRLAATTAAAPLTGFTAVDEGDRYIRLSWQNVSSQPAGFILQYRLAGATTWTTFGNILPANPNSVTVTGLLPSTSYEFRIMSIEPGKASTYQELPAPLPVTIKPIQEWRRSYFGSPANADDGANMADPDADGSPNLMEYALGTNPLVANPQEITARSAPYTNMAGYNTNYMEFWCNGFNTDINYTIQTSSDLVKWNVLEKSIGGQRFQNSGITDSYYPYPDRDPHRKVTASVISSSPRFFFRVSIESTE